MRFRVPTGPERAVFDHENPHIEHIGGPHDGEFRRLNENGMRANGRYVVVMLDEGNTSTICKRFVPTPRL